jgi:hypothetical protein
MAITLTEWAQLLSKASDGLHGHIARALVNTALRAEAEAKRNVTGGGSSTTQLNVRSGRLRASIAGSVRDMKSLVRVEVTAGGRSPHPDQLKRDTTRNPGVASYARMHEEGGIIRPKRAKMLSIPIHKSLFTGAGVLRDARGPRAVPNLTFVRSLKGAFLLSNKFTGEPWFLLKRQVTIKPRPFLGPGMRTAVEKQMPGDLGQALESLLEVT